MDFVQMRFISICRLCILCEMLLFPLIESDIRSPRPFIRNVGQDAVFMWNSTTGHRIYEAKFGLLSDGLVKPQFIYVDMFNNTILSSDLDGSASRYKGRVYWVGDISKGRVWFKLTNLTLNDTNEYIAGIVEEGKPTRLYSAKLTTAALPQFTPHPLVAKSIAEGKDLIIQCAAIGPPTPSITWVKIENHVIKSTGTGNATLRISNITRHQIGVYECQARNNPNERPVTAQTVVTVHFKPAILESQSSSKFKSWNGNNIRLRCLATGLPAPRISWYKPTNQQITTGANIVPGGSVGSEVTVLTTADPGDYGQYKCRATNILGSDEHVINVTQLFSPGRVTMTITEIEASSITIRWTKPAEDDELAVASYLLEVSSKQPVIKVNTHAVITGLKASTQYTVNVYARNAVGYGVVSSKVVETKGKGKPAVPVMLSALLEAAGSKLSVVLRWEEPAHNGDKITRYTIYIKIVTGKDDWTKYDDVKTSNRLEYRITKNIVYGRTYMFMVTAWNKYGESVKDEGGAKTVNTTATKAASTSANKIPAEEGSKSSYTALGVVIAFLVLSLGLNVLQFLCRRRTFLRSRKGSPSQKHSSRISRKRASKNVTAAESYENDFEMEDKPTTSVSEVSPAQPLSAPEYATIPSVENADLNKIHSSNDTCNYQELNLLSTTSTEGTHGPVYEPLHTRSVEPSTQHSDNEQHPYEPLDIRNQISTYQSLQSNRRESVI